MHRQAVFSLVAAATLIATVTLQATPLLAAWSKAADDTSGGQLPAEVRSHLIKQGESLRAFRLEVTSSVSTTAGGTPANQQSATVYFDGNRFRCRREMTIRGASRPQQVQEMSFDGSTFYLGTPDISKSRATAGLMKFSIADRNDPKRDELLIQIPYLDGAGFYVPSSVAELENFTLGSLVLHDLQQSTSAEVEKGEAGHLRVTVQIPDHFLLSQRQVEVGSRIAEMKLGPNTPAHIDNERRRLEHLQSLEPIRIVTFELDPEHGYGVSSRQESTFAGKPIVRYELGEWKYYDSPGIWLPQRCVKSYFVEPERLTEHSDKPLAVETTQLTSFENGEHAGVQFALNYQKAGALIADRTHPDAQSAPNHQVQFAVAANGEELRRVGSGLVNESAPQQRWKTWLIAINIVVIAAIGLAMLVRRATRTSF